MNYSIEKLREAQKVISADIDDLIDYPDCIVDIMNKIREDAVIEVLGDDVRIDLGMRGNGWKNVNILSGGHRYTYTLDDELYEVLPDILRAESWEDVYDACMWFIEQETGKAISLYDQVEAEKEKTGGDFKKFNVKLLRRIGKALEDNDGDFFELDLDSHIADMVEAAAAELWGPVDFSEPNTRGRGYGEDWIWLKDGRIYKVDIGDEEDMLYDALTTSKDWSGVMSKIKEFLQSHAKLEDSGDGDEDFDGDDEDLDESICKKSGSSKLTEAKKESLFDKVTASFDAKLRKFAKDNLCTKQIFKDYLEEFEGEKEALEATRADFLESVEGYMSENGIETAAEAQEQSDMLANAAKVLKAFEKVLGE